MIIVGIDPGVSGAICIFNNGNFNIYQMPAQDKLIDVRSIIPIIRGSDVVAIESVHAHPNQGVVSTGNFMKGFGTLLGCLHTMKEYGDIKDIMLVSPQRWKKHILGPGKHEKIDSIDVALKYVDKSILLKSKRAHKPNDGMAESLLICIYCYETTTGSKLCQFQQ